MADIGVSNMFELVGLTTGTTTGATVTIGGVSFPCELIAVDIKPEYNTTETKGSDGKNAFVHMTLLKTVVTIELIAKGSAADTVITNFGDSIPDPLEKVTIANVHKTGSTVKPNGDYYYVGNWGAPIKAGEAVTIRMDIAQYPGMTPA